MNASTTPRLNLPFLQAGQALKNITHNEALQRLDTGLYLSCDDMNANTLPPTAEAGTAIILSDTPEANFSKRMGQIAVFVNGSWAWFSPTPGWTIWDNMGQTLRVFNGEDWVRPTPDTLPENLPYLGLNTSATPAQRFAVASETSLFNHDGNSHRLTLNRAAKTDTASLVFQTEFEGEAEIGLTGTNGFSLKTSADGLTFSDRLTAPDSFSGIKSPAFGSVRVSIDNDAADLIPTPATGGLVAFTVVSDNGFPQISRSGLFAYDTGPTPALVNLAATSRVENHGSTPLTGTTSAEGNIGISAVDGGLYFENRIAGSRDISLVFLC